MNNYQPNISVIGLGYVGLPLAVEFSKKFKTVGYDISSSRVSELKSNFDSTNEVSKKDLLEVKYLHLTNDANDLRESNTYIVTVPTPITTQKLPDLKPLKNACSLISKNLKRGDLVVFESTVYPGATREVCVPILENSGLRFNIDFSCGYSPERINPGDKTKTLRNIMKIVSGSNLKALKQVKYLYESIIDAGIYEAKSIEIAEAAKVIENTQRDINIALINEFSVLFNKMGLNTSEILEAAETKWNFLPFKPGLVGGHCIGVDPYYLTFRAKQFNYKPKVILAGRKLNDSMPDFICENLIEKFASKNQNIKDKEILIMGLSFKEDCPDFRNSKVFGIVKNLLAVDSRITVVDPYIHQIQSLENCKLYRYLPKKKFDAILLCVAHKQFRNLGYKNIREHLKKSGLFFDIKNIFPNNQADFRL